MRARALHLAILLTALALISTAAFQPSNELGLLNGYLVKAESGVAAAELRRVSARVLGDAWEVVEGWQPGYYRVQPTSEVAVPSAHAAAWDIAHALRDSGTVVWAEPAFETSLHLQQDSSDPVGECQPKWDDFGPAPEDPGAMRDSEWSLKEHPGVNAQAAWTLFDAIANAGANVVVGHPDTGYLDHTAIKPARLGDGFDFTSGRNSAIDVAAAGNLQWPGHGTRTSSVIAGRPFMAEGGVRRISGVAPGALFMPLKVAHRVVLLPFLEFDMENLAMAIHAAAIGDPNFVEQPAAVISISLGGRNSRAVEDALRVAEQHNVIVLAAAGNRVPRRVVVFPARYPSVLAIAASNSKEEPWPYTSRGRTVAISAPGQNVWTAKRRQANGVSYDCAEMSSGTSYAVATTAGVAALWLSYHKKIGDLTQVKSRSQAFRQLVRDTAWVPATWDAQKLGPGIVDARKLLEANVPSLTVREGPRYCSDMVALASIVTPQMAAALLTGTRNVAYACGVMGQTGDEMASLYSIDPRAVAAFEHFLESNGTLDDVEILRDAVLALPLSTSLQSRLRAAEKNPSRITSASARLKNTRTGS